MSPSRNIEFIEGFGHVSVILFQENFLHFETEGKIYINPFCFLVPIINRNIFDSILVVHRSSELQENCHLICCKW